jgi:hypothetical protein
VKVVVVVGVAAALSVAVVLQLAPPRFRHEFQPRCPMQHALEKYSVGFLNVAPIPVEPPPDIFHRSSQGSNDFSSIRTRKFRNQVM